MRPTGKANDKSNKSKLLVIGADWGAPVLGAGGAGGSPAAAATPVAGNPIGLLLTLTYS